jgi:hypothetical protein
LGDGDGRTGRAFTAALLEFVFEEFALERLFLDEPAFEEFDIVLHPDWRCAN